MKCICGKCGSETVIQQYLGWYMHKCPRCGFEGTSQDHIQERDRRIEAAFFARAQGPGYLGDQWSSVELVNDAESDIAALDAAAQARTAPPEVNP